MTKFVHVAWHGKCSATWYRSEIIEHEKFSGIYLNSIIYNMTKFYCTAKGRRAFGGNPTHRKPDIGVHVCKT